MGILSYGYKARNVGKAIKSVPISKDVKKFGIKHSVAKTRLNESSKRSAQVDKNYKTMADAKKAFTGGTQKTTGTGAINTTNISKNLKEFQTHK